jgi:hypothetical protein
MTGTLTPLQHTPLLRAQKLPQLQFSTFFPPDFLVYNPGNRPTFQESEPSQAH